MEYPKDVLTVSKKGKTEVRVLVRRGEFVEYGYADPETWKTERKRKIVLRSGDKQEAYFIIPLKDGKCLMLKESVDKKAKLWDGKKPVDLWE